jgi:hypothetical protein
LIFGLEVLGLGPESDPPQFFCKFLKLNVLKTEIPVLNTARAKGLKYSYLNISEPMHYRNMASLELMFVLLCYRETVG